MFNGFGAQLLKLCIFSHCYFLNEVYKDVFVLHILVNYFLRFMRFNGSPWMLSKKR